MNSIKSLMRKCIPRGLRNWVRTPGKTSGYIFDRGIYALGSRPKIQIKDDWSVSCHPAAKDHFSVFRTDPSQRDELDSFVENSRPGMHLLDIGAHYGFFALAALHFGGKDARVICVEPSTRAANILKANLAANHEESRVKVIEAAMGGEDGQLAMLTTGPAGADYLVVPSEQRADAVFIAQRSMPSILRETGFVPTHIKMDIEGYEFETIQSAISLLAELKPVLYLELHGNFLTARKKDPAIVIANLRQAGYKTFLLSGRAVDEEEMARQQFICRMVCLT